MVAHDPLASLRIDPITVTVGEYDYTCEGRPASDWVELILADRLHMIIPGWLDDDDGVISRGLLDGDVTFDELNELTFEVLTIAAGRPWWWAAQLTLTAASSASVWATLHGRMIMHGVLADDISFAAWIDALYACMTENMDSEALSKFNTEMDTPPASVGLDEEAESDAFLALMGSLPG